MGKGRGDYEIGKGKPPEWSRFRKGQSGNPRGRPRKKPADTPIGDSAIDELHRQILNRKITIKEGGKARVVSLHEAVMQSQIRTAAKGNPLAQRDVLASARELEARDEQRQLARQEEDRKFFETLVRFRETQRKVWASEREGEEPDAPWPHPDDILIDEVRQTGRIRGPLSEADLPLFEYFEAERDAAFAEAELVFRDRRNAGQANVMVRDLVWRIYDILLPLRWQIGRDLDRWQFKLAMPGTAKLRRIRDELRAHADILKVRANLPPQSREAYRFANTTMKPILQRYGYRSLAQFERAWDESGGDPPWRKE